MTIMKTKILKIATQALASITASLRANPGLPLMQPQGGKKTSGGSGHKGPRRGRDGLTIGERAKAKYEFLVESCRQGIEVAEERRVARQQGTLHAFNMSHFPLHRHTDKQAN